MIENKQRQPPPFLFQLNSEQTDMCTLPIKTARTSIFSSHSLDEVAFLIFCPPPVLLSPSCQYRPKASDIVRAKSGLCILHSALLLPKPHRGLWLYIVYNARYSLPGHCAIRPKSQTRRPELPPQQIRTLKKCPFVLLHHFFFTTITHSFLSSVNLTLLLFLQCNNFFIFCLVSLQQGANVKEKGILNYFLRSWSADVLSCSAGLLLVSFRFDSKLDSVGKKPGCYSQPNAGIKENVW